MAISLHEPNHLKHMNLTPIYHKLKAMQCSTHLKSADITLKGEDIKITNQCCDTFLKKLKQEYEKQITMLGEKEITDTLNKTFGKHLKK